MQKISKKGIMALVLIALMVGSLAVVAVPNAAYATVTPGQNTVIFKESGLATGTAFDINFNGVEHTSTGVYNNISVAANGTYDFSVINPNGYSGSPSSGVVSITDYNVAGATNVTENIVFTSTAKTYQVTFYSGTSLTSGLVWSVTVNGQTVSSNTNTVSFNLANGTYNFNIPDVGHFYATPFSGTFTVNGNTNLPKWMNGAVQNNVTFRYGYLVTFKASGLPLYVPWSVTFNGTTNSTTGTSSFITFSIANGTNYKYTISIAPNWQASPLSGSLNVSGAAVTQTITFTEVFYKIIFVETGLPIGTAWVLTVNGIPYTTTNGTVIIANVHNGTFVWSAESEPGYTASPASGSVVLQYQDPTPVHIVYSTATIHSTTGNSSGGFTISTQGMAKFFESTMGEITIAAIVVLALVGLMYEFGGKKGKKSRKNYK
jgi:hypothetical protein